MLLVFSGAVFVFLWLPFTLFLLLGPLLQRYSHLTGLKWVGRRAPILDAFYGPLKHRHRYWVGTLLLARVIAFIPTAIPSLNASGSVFTVALLSTGLLFFTSITGGMYKAKYLSVLEDSFLVNLIVYSALVSYSNSTKQIAGYISFVQVVLTLVTISVVSVYKKCSSSHYNESAPSFLFKDEYLDLDETRST